MAEEQSGGAPLRRGVVWSVVGYGGSQFLRLLSNLILTRLLFPEAFGVMALASTFMQGLQLFSDVGIGPSIIQNKGGDKAHFVNTAFSIQSVRGAALSCIAFFCGGPLAYFYGEPQLAWVIPVAGLSAFISGHNSTKLFTMNRSLNLKRIALVDLGAQGASICVMVGWALVDRSIWALVFGGLTMSFTKMALSHLVLPGQRNRFQWNREAAKELFQFGKWIFLSTILTFLTAHSDRLIFGKMVPMGMLGVYNIGAMLATLPTYGLGYVAGHLIFPHYSQLHREGRLKETFRKTRFTFLVAGGFAASGFIAGGDTGIRMLYDEPFHDAGWVVQLLSVGTWFALLEESNRAALLAKGDAHLMTAAGAAKIVGMAICIPLGFSQMGFKGAVLGFTAAEVFRYGLTAIFVQRADLKGFSQDVGLSALVTASVAGGMLTAHHLRNRTHVIVEALMLSLVVTLFWLPLGLGPLRDFFKRRSKT